MKFDASVHGRQTKLTYNTTHSMWVCHAINCILKEKEEYNSVWNWDLSFWLCSCIFRLAVVVVIACWMSFDVIERPFLCNKKLLLFSNRHTEEKIIENIHNTHKCDDLLVFFIFPKLQPAPSLQYPPPHFKWLITPFGS